MTLPASLNFGSLPDTSRFNLAADPRGHPLVKLGNNAYEETGATVHFSVSADAPVIPLPDTEPPALSPPARINFLNERRGHEWNMLACLYELAPGTASYSTLWEYCQEHILAVFRIESETQASNALQRLLNWGLIAHDQGTYRITGAGIRRRAFDTKKS